MILLDILPNTLSFAFWLHARLIYQFGSRSHTAHTRSPGGTKKIRRSS